jgi:hypothetical protein
MMRRTGPEYRRYVVRQHDHWRAVLDQLDA